jgi:hypothetical protein
MRWRPSWRPVDLLEALPLVSRTNHAKNAHASTSLQTAWDSNAHSRRIELSVRTGSGRAVLEEDLSDAIRLLQAAKCPVSGSEIDWTRRSSDRLASRSGIRDQS